MANHKLISITSFGGFSVSACDENGVFESISDSKGHSKKLWLLIYYLIFSGKDFVLSSELIELLWSEGASVADPLASLRLLVHRARSELSKLGAFKGSELILCYNEAYSWNRNVTTIVDAESFESLCLSAAEGDRKTRINTILKAAEIYKGHFIPKASQYHWAMALDAYYHSQYISICSQGTSLLMEDRRYADIIELCTAAVSIDPYCEPLHIALIEALVASGSHTSALDHYKSISERLLNEFGISPSSALLATYKTILSNINTPEMDISEIRKEMTEPNPVGAFRCEYELFKHIYWLKSRECVRRGQAVQLALVTILPKGEAQMSPRTIKSAFEKLTVLMRDMLLQSDLFTRYSVNQCLILLQSTSYEDGQLVLDRLQGAFAQASHKSGLQLQCSLIPMLPATFDETSGDIEYL